ncbi:hypothetical protein AN901_200628 [Pseudomonas syringae pv. theae]|nr:hypothetical protein AN901_200628 [Pseudomonas syringae pv. theae]MBL3873517.1 hypothetical protein [Pseudomonas syringae pv. theae]
MALGNFRCHLRDSVEILATHNGNVKTRLYLAISNRLVLANVPEAPELPDYFRQELDAILDFFKTKHCPLRGSTLASLHGMKLVTAAKIASRIWSLHSAFEAFIETGNLPSSP